MIYTTWDFQVDLYFARPDVSASRRLRTWTFRVFTGNFRSDHIPPNFSAESFRSVFLSGKAKLSARRRWWTTADVSQLLYNKLRTPASPEFSSPDIWASIPAYSSGAPVVFSGNCRGIWLPKATDTHLGGWRCTTNGRTKRLCTHSLFVEILKRAVSGGTVHDFVFKHVPCSNVVCLPLDASSKNGWFFMYLHVLDVALATALAILSKLIQRS